MLKMNKKKEKKVLLKMVRRYGYVPGKYLKKCGGCTKLFEGDKRAIICFECACRSIIK